MDDAGNCPVPLSALPRGTRGVVVNVLDEGLPIDDALQSRVSQRLLELGFVSGAAFEIVEAMWPGGDPLAVRVQGSTFALRRREAAAVIVRVAA